MQMPRIHNLFVCLHFRPNKETAISLKKKKTRGNVSDSGEIFYMYAYTYIYTCTYTCTLVFVHWYLNLNYL